MAPLTVILPFYNAAETLRAAVDSVIAQTYRDWKLLLVDDGSNDGSQDLAAELAQTDDRISVMTLPRTGIVGALQAGCHAARSEFIARMDADDISLPTRFAKQLALMETDPSLALIGTQVIMTGSNVAYGRKRYETWINELTSPDAIASELFVECPLPHPTFMMRREAFESIGGYQEHGWAEDYDLCMRTWRAGFRMGKVAEPLLEWTESPKRLSMVNERYTPARFRELKRHYLSESYLGGERSFCQWGAGEVGKKWLREWTDGRPSAVVDIDPRKVGTKIHGYRVITPEQLPTGEFVVIAVGALTARTEIRAWLEPRGCRECHDFLFLA